MGKNRFVNKRRYDDGGAFSNQIIIKFWQMLLISFVNLIPVEVMVGAGVGVVGVGVLTRNDLVRRNDRRSDRLRNERKMLAAVDDPCLVGVPIADAGVTGVVVAPPVPI